MTKEDILDILETGVTARVFCNLRPEKGKKITHKVVISGQLKGEGLTVMETDDYELALDAAKLLHEIDLETDATIVKEGEVNEEARH